MTLRKPPEGVAADGGDMSMPMTTDPIALTEKQKRALLAVCPRARNIVTTRGGWFDPKQISADTPPDLRKSYAVWNALTNYGLLVRRQQSEQLRGEPRVFWSEYRLTEQGLDLGLTLYCECSQ